MSDQLVNDGIKRVSPPVVPCPNKDTIQFIPKIAPPPVVSHPKKNRVQFIPSENRVKEPRVST